LYFGFFLGFGEGERDRYSVVLREASIYCIIVLWLYVFVGVYHYFQIKLLLYFVNSFVLLAPRVASTGGGTWLN
jgi:hypothetical protein